VKRKQDLCTEPLRLGEHLVPGIWRYLFPDDLADFRFPSECQSTCNACPKVKEEGFHPDYRCCTYHPRIPNFLLGFALEDSDTRPYIDQLIQDGLATPEGLQATPGQMRHSLIQASSGDFGKVDAVVCRFLDAENRQCRIYKYRNSVCSTFFCKHDHGDTGAAFWEKLQSVVGQYETVLSQWVMGKLGVEPKTYFERFDELATNVARDHADFKGGWTPSVAKHLWGEWFGKEAEFFLAGAALVREHKASLVTILESTPLLAPNKFDAAFRDALPEILKTELDANGVTAGVPALGSDLWYVFKLAHRNLFRS